MQCRLCGSERLKLYYTQGNDAQFKFYKCAECGLVNYDLSGGLDQQKYADVYPDPFDENNPININQTITFRFIQAHLNFTGKVLDIGCGNGRLLHLFKNAGWSTKGLELSPFLAQSIKDTLDIEVETANFLEHHASDEGKYDLVILRHVLEHLPDPIVAMKKINAYLKPNRYAVLEFPNIEALDLKIKRLLQRLKLYQKKYKANFTPGHCNEYCKHSFTYLASKTGFDLNVWETYSYKPLSNFIYNRLHIGSKARVILKKIEPA
jgi:2-polyprenyl-3-methyl-5-hydroxy-6-metoxy-1,4-benzoquinol methylase